jgi:hypothetical protein
MVSLCQQANLLEELDKKINKSFERYYDKWMLSLQKYCEENNEKCENRTFNLAEKAFFSKTRGWFPYKRLEVVTITSLGGTWV